MYLISHTDCAQESNETRRKKFHQLVDFKQLASTKQIHLHTSWFTTRKAMLNLIPLDDSHHLSYVLINTSKKIKPLTSIKLYQQSFSIRLSQQTKICHDLGGVWVSFIFSKVLTALSWVLGLINDLLSNCHLLGLICPSIFICSLLNFLFAYHLPPRQPKA